MGAGESKEKKPTPSARTVHGHGNGHGPSRWASNIWRSLKKSPRLRKKSKESQKSKKSSSDSDGSKQEQQPVQTEHKNGTIPTIVPDVDEQKNNMDAINNNEETVLRRTESEVSKSEISIQLVEEEKQRESPAECEREQKDGEHFTERELLEPQAYKGNLEHDDIPTIDNSIASMSPRTFDDIPVSTVFAEEKSRENSDTRKSTTSLKSQNSRKISRESRDSKKSKKSEKSEKSNQSENEPDSESVETAKKLKKQLEDTISELLSAATRAEQYLEDSSEKEKMSKDDFDNIHQIVGQTRLLCQDKLGKQFRNLCLKTLGEVERKNGEAAPTKMDLIGFWELVSIQVDQSKSSLKELHDKKDNDWKEIEKEKTPVTKPKKVTPKTKSTTRSAPSEAQKKRDAERKARLAEMRAKTLAAKKAAEKAGAEDTIIISS